MRLTRWLAPIVTLTVCGFCGLGGFGAACSSSSSSPGSPDASSPDGASEAALSCGNIAACYGVTVTVDPGAPATCGSGVYNAVSDYTAVTGDGAFTTAAGCSGQLSSCEMTLMCPGGVSWKYTFTDAGFTATITQTTNQVVCQATAVGTRLASCPVPVDGGGPDGASTPDAGGADGGMEAAGDSGAESGGPPSEAGGSDAAGPDGSADAGPQEAAAPDGAFDGSGVADAGAPDGADDGSGDAAALPESGADAGDGATD
jgi:hypothetical protein